MTQKKGSVTTPDLAALREDYLSTVPLAERFAHELAQQLTALLADANVHLSSPVERRVKSWASIVEKIQRRSLSPARATDVPDLVGVRALLLFKPDLDKARELVKRKFVVDAEEDTSGRLATDQFGYASVHYEIRLREEWFDLPTLAPLRGFRAELQLRTTAQHMWAAAAHVLQYKHEESVPLALRRAISRVSALLETVDLEFTRVLVERDAYRLEAGASPEDSPLNVDLLEKTLDAILPPQNKEQGREKYAELLKDLAHFGVATRRQLEELVKRRRAHILAQDARQARESLREFGQEPGQEPYDEPDLPRWARGVFYTHGGLVRTALHAEYPEQWKEWVSKMRPGPKAKTPALDTRAE